MKAYEGLEVQLPSFLLSSLLGGECSSLLPAVFPAENTRRYALNRGLGGPQSKSGLFRK
jgi:hypothetical protein